MNELNKQGVKMGHSNSSSMRRNEWVERASLRNGSHLTIRIRNERVEQAGRQNGSHTTHRAWGMKWAAQAVAHSRSYINITHQPWGMNEWVARYERALEMRHTRLASHEEWTSSTIRPLGLQLANLREKSTETYLNAKKCQVVRWGKTEWKTSQTRNEWVKIAKREG